MEVTFVIATAAALLSVLVGTPFAYLLARSEFKFKEVIEAIIDIPIMVPHVVVGIMIVLAFSSQYGLGPFLKGLGINMIDTLIGAIVTVTYLSATYSIRVTETSIKTINPDIELTARTLGSSPAFTFIHVIVPKNLEVNSQRSITHLGKGSCGGGSAARGSLLCILQWE